MEIRDIKLQKKVDMTKGTEYAPRVYGELVEHFVRDPKYGYNASKVESIINNYLDEPNEKHTKEFQDLQAYRKECKRVAKEVLEID